ncbi:MAG: hypothetical protein AAGI17_05830 [Planctomycetota bacterium]
MVLGPCLIAACAQDASSAADPALRAEGQEVFSNPTDPSETRAGTRSSRRSGNGSGLVGDTEQWVISLRRVGTTTDREGLLAAVRELPGLRDARVETRLGADHVVVGGFSDPRSSEATRRLAEVRATEVNGQYPFRSAVQLPPVIQAATGERAAFDLRNANTRDAAATLLIEQFLVESDRPSKREIERMRGRVESRVAELRDEGVEAYFYHTASASTITVGLFRASEVDASPTPGFSPRHSAKVLALMERFSNQRFNGKPADPPVPSTPVQIPD